MAFASPDPNAAARYALGLMPRKNRHAVALGRKGGKAGKGKTSEAKAAASRKNGRKGGRPKLTSIAKPEEGLL